jgi:signal transduction histidine kinase
MSKRIYFQLNTMNPLWSALTHNTLEAIPERHRAEFEREIAVANMRRIRTMLVFAACGCAALVYGVNVQNVMHLSESQNRIVLAMHLFLLFLTSGFLVVVLLRPLRTPQDFTGFHRRLFASFLVLVVIAPQSLMYAIITTNGHPIFFLAAVLIWYSSLLVPVRWSVLVVTLLLIGFWIQLFAFLPPTTEENQFPKAALIFSLASGIALLISGGFLFQSTVESFCQRKAVEEERNRVAELNAELGAAYLETDTMNRELVQRQEILEEQAMEIEIINTQLNEQNEVLVALNEEKNEMLGIVSHDLKNPISAVRGLAEILESEKIEPEQTSEILRHIIGNADRMLELVKNLLDVNQLESGAWQFQRVAFDILPLVADVVKDYHIAAKAKNILLEYSSEAASTLVSADKQATVQVLDNLVSNAVKYSPLGKRVYIRIKANNQAVSVEVQDEGQGISASEMKKLFGKFARLSTRPTGGEHSTGLGLSIVKKMVEAMNGKVWCESELGKGATFIVELPNAQGFDV